MTKKPTKIYDMFDVVVVPFPFIDTETSKRRPALVLSSNANFNGRANACVMAMITSKTHSPWPLDIEIQDLEKAGLPVKSIVRMKLFTLDQRLILYKIGTLETNDQKQISKNVNAIFSMKH